MLTDISQKLSRVGIDPAGSIYIADSALVTEDNLRLSRGYDALYQPSAGHLWRTSTPDRASGRKVSPGKTMASWPHRATRNRPGIHYRGYETTVNLYERTYRAVVVHSSAHDRRRQKRLQRQLETEASTWSKKLEEIEKTHYFCRRTLTPPWSKAPKRKPSSIHQLELTVVEKPQYARGRPKADGSRALKHMRYGITAQLTAKAEAIATMKEQAGCFVLITNVAPQGPPECDIPYDGKTILQAYKDQNGIEHNFGFLKDPVLINCHLPQKARTHRSLGLILVISLLLWRLIELTMRRHLEKHQARFPAGTTNPRNVPPPS